MNLSLSKNRINAVRDYLVENGIPSTSILTEAYGESNPIAPNTTREGRRQNRRVEVVRIK